MARSDIPQHVRQLILRHIDSVQQVEILGLLRDEPDRDWAAAEISKALHIPPAACGAWLEEFAAAGLVARGENGVRHASGAAQSQAADDLVDLYGRRRLTVIDSIYNKPSSAIQSFSDAFRLRGRD